MKSNDELIDEIDTTLAALEGLMPDAGDHLDKLCVLYTATYMLKLRAM